MDRATFPSAGNSLQPADTRTFRFEGVALDLARGSLRGANGEIQLRPKSLEVLRYLVSNPGRLVAKDELLGAVWPDVTVSEEFLHAASATSGLPCRTARRRSSRPCRSVVIGLMRQ